LPKQPDPEQIIRFADMFSAMGTEPRLRIMQLLLSAIPRAWWWATSAANWKSPAQRCHTIWDKLKNEDLVKVRREGTFLWYTANTGALQELLGFLYAECCTRNRAVKPENIVTSANRRKPWLPRTSRK